MDVSHSALFMLVSRYTHPTGKYTDGTVISIVIKLYTHLDTRGQSGDRAPWYGGFLPVKQTHHPMSRYIPP